ncbi:MAG: DUF3429 domain-containing protein [Alphaproteobacteria bacterium]
MTNHHHHDHEHEPGRIPEPAAALGYLGALPFVVCATAIWLGAAEIREPIVTLIAALGAVLLAFMGGVRWGLAMGDEGGPGFLALGISVTPAIISGVALLLIILGPGAITTTAAALGLLVVSLLALLWSDLAATCAGDAPEWYPGLRIPLTALVVVSLIASLARIVLDVMDKEPL